MGGWRRGWVLQDGGCTEALSEGVGQQQYSRREEENVWEKNKVQRPDMDISLCVTQYG